MTILTSPTAVLFDWDNTLVDTWPLIYGGMRVVFENKGLAPWTLQETKDRCHESAREALPKLFPNDWQSAMDDFYGYIHTRHLDDLVLLPFANELIKSLTARRIPLGLVSNKSKQLLVKEVAHLSFSEYFGTVVGSADAVRDKPDPAPVQLALNQLGIEPSMDIWLIGDTPVDWKSAKSAGVRAIGVGAAKIPEGIEAPDVMFPDLEPLYLFVNKDKIAQQNH
jgi:phosphoglycolate phosphatase